MKEYLQYKIEKKTRKQKVSSVLLANYQSMRERLQ